MKAKHRKDRMKEGKKEGMIRGTKRLGVTNN